MAMRVLYQQLKKEVITKSLQAGTRNEKKKSYFRPKRMTTVPWDQWITNPGTDVI